MPRFTPPKIKGFVIAGIARLLRPAPVILAALLGALPAQADRPLTGLRAAVDSGSDRLALYALAQSRLPGAAPLVSAFGARVGLAHQGTGLQALDRHVALSPVLTYDGNYNAGIPGQTITLAGLRFRVNEADRAKSGLVAGGAINGGASFSYGRGSRLFLTARVGANSLLRNGMWRLSVGGQTCAQQHLHDWTWLDGCIGLSAERRSFDRDLVERTASLGPTTLFTLGGVDQQLGMRLQYRDRTDYAQPSVALNWIGAVPDMGAVGLSGLIAREVEGENTALRSLSLSLIRPLNGRPIRLGMDWTRAGGATVFGSKRRDNVLGLSLSAPVTPRIVIDARLARRNSNIDVYDETLVNIGFRLTRR